MADDLHSRIDRVYVLMVLMIKRLIISAVVLMALLGVGVITVEAVLRSDLPRRMVVDRLQNETGLIWNVKSLRAGWRGNTVLKDVEIRLPLEDQPLLKAGEVRVRHTPVLTLLLGGIAIDMIAITGPAVDIIQERDGTLNLQRALDAIVVQQSSLQRPTGWRAAVLPRLDITQAVISITNDAGITQTIDAASLQGGPIDPLTWRFDLAMPGAGDLRGKLASGGTWRHDIDFDVRDIAAAMHLLNDADAKRLRSLHIGSGTWTGHWRGSSLHGRLSLKSAAIDHSTATGSISVRLTPDRTIVDEIAVDVRSSLIEGGRGYLTGGPILADSDRLRFDGLHLRDAESGSEAVIRGEWHAASRTGSINAQWNATHGPVGMQHHGRVDATIDLPVIGEARVKATVETSGSADISATWDGRLQLEARGESFEHARFMVKAERLHAHVLDRSQQLDGAVVEIHRDGNVMHMDRIILPGVRSQTEGHYNLVSGEWSLALSLRQWIAPEIDGVPELGPLDVRCALAGDPSKIDVSTFTVMGPNIQWSATGTYRYEDSLPLQANMQAKLQPDDKWSIAWADASLARSRSDAATTGAGSLLADVLTAVISPTPPAFLRGKRSHVEAHVTVSGSVVPLGLAIGGTIVAKDVPITDRKRIDRVEAVLRAHANESDVRFTADAQDVLGGTARVDGRYERSTGEVSADIHANDVHVDQLQRFIDHQMGLKGRLAMTGTLRVEGAGLSSSPTARFDGTWRIAGAEAVEQHLGELEGRIALHDGVVDLTDVAAARDDGSALNARASIELLTGLLNAEAHASAWRLRAPELDAGVVLTGSANMTADMAAGTMKAAMDMAGEIELGHGTGEGDLVSAPVRMTAQVADNQLMITNGDIMALGGIANITGSMPLNNWRQMKADVRWVGLELHRVREVWPRLAVLPENMALKGSVDGTMRVQPAVDSRAPEPMQVSITLQPNDAKLGSLELRESTLTLHIGPKRAMVDASHVELAGGSIDAWGQLSWAHDGPFAQLQASFVDLELDQLVRLADHESEPVPGRVNGRLAAGGYVLPPHRSFGQAELSLRDSDLANVPLFSVLYRTMNLRISKPEPEGAGMLRARLDGDALDVTRMTYFNRGIDVVSLLRIDNVWAGAESPIHGFAVGAFRPLKKIDLPLIRDIDTAMKVFQAGAGSVRIEGTVGEHEIKPVPFVDIAGAVRSALRGL